MPANTEEIEIRSLHYLLPVLQELQNNPPDELYLNYLAERFRRLVDHR